MGGVKRSVCVCVASLSGGESSDCLQGLGWDHLPLIPFSLLLPLLGDLAMFGTRFNVMVSDCPWPT